MAGTVELYSRYEERLRCVYQADSGVWCVSEVLTRESGVMTLGEVGPPDPPRYWNTRCMVEVGSLWPPVRWKDEVDGETDD